VGGLSKAGWGAGSSLPRCDDMSRGGNPTISSIRKAGAVGSVAMQSAAATWGHQP
jgi:hypothetical protein